MTEPTAINNHKLTGDERSERNTRILQLHAEGRTIRAIAAEVGCSPMTVQGVCAAQSAADDHDDHDEDGRDDAHAYRLQQAQAQELIDEHETHTIRATPFTVPPHGGYTIPIVTSGGNDEHGAGTADEPAPIDAAEHGREDGADPVAATFTGNAHDDGDDGCVSTEVVAVVEAEIIDPDAVVDLSEMDLPELAAVANRHHANAETAGRSMLECAWHAGSALVAAKVQVKHGEWTPWLVANFHGSDRTARAYMRVAVSSNRQRAADLDPRASIRAALESIKTPKPPAAPRPKPMPLPGTVTPIRPGITASKPDPELALFPDACANPDDDEGPDEPGDDQVATPLEWASSIANAGELPERLRWYADEFVDQLDDQQDGDDDDDVNIVLDRIGAVRLVALLRAAADGYAG
jgi:hypothetical protein